METLLELDSGPDRFRWTACASASGSSSRLGDARLHQPSRRRL